MKRNIPLILAGIALGALLAMPVLNMWRGKGKHLTRVTVIGDANLKAQPDTAVLVLSVVTQSPQALAAQQENARKSEAVISAVKQSAGAEPEVKTSDYSLQPQRSYRDNRMPSIIGYEARNTVTIKTSDLKNTGAVIDAASRAGANSVESINFILRDDNPARGDTLAEATRQAMVKAEGIAKALGGRVVRVVEEIEGGAAARSSYGDYAGSANMNSNMMRADYAVKPAYTTPLEAGSLNVTSQVQVVVEIEVKP
ncbi:MAG: SIMPL domain-containing protein [Pyrinomonadaceae bacterium MAG19_C2-C3]|nr:SIMPL domain-containing protein [Pyrinomonadaceae bacterium MAG19_C2-C3]